MSLSSKSDKEYPLTPTIPSERIKTLLEMINKNFDSSTTQTAPSETKKVVQTQVDISLNDEDKSISSSNQTHQSINFISSLSKPDPKETKSVVHFSQKPKSKRVCSSNNKTEITINLITLDNNEISHKILNDNYHYLTQTFNDEIDMYSSIHNNVKAYLTEEKINEYLKKKVNTKHTLSFGDEPIKIYKDVLYDKLTCIGRTQHHAKDSGDNIQDVLCSLPVLKAPESAFVNLSRSYYPCYMFSQAQISRMKNKKLNATASNAAVHRHNNNNHIGVNDDNGNDSSSCNKKLCSCCMEAKKYGKECHCSCNIKIKNDINNNNNNNNNILGGSSDEDKHYNCNFCSCKFTSPQGLGGHMSRTHKSQSLKFLKKKEIRNNREPQRKLLEEAKRILCENHKRDYYMLLKSKQGKEIIKQLILNHQKEFKLIRKQLDNHNNNNNTNNNNNNINTFNVNINSNKHCNGQTNKLIDIGNKELSVEEE